MSRVPSARSQMAHERAGRPVNIDLRPRPPKLTGEVVMALREDHRTEAGKRIAVHRGADGWMNELTSIGIKGKDPAMFTRFGHEAPTGFAELEQLYRHEGIGRKIVDYPVREMFRRGFYVEGDPEGEAVDFLHKSGIISALQQGYSWGRLFGGGLGVMLVDDGATDLSQPLDLRNVRSFQGINNFDRWQVSWYADTLYTDPTQPKYMMPMLYQVFPIYGQPFWVHESRVIRYHGNPLTNRLTQLNMGWDDSVLQSVWAKLKTLGEVMGYTKSMMRTFVVQTLSMEGISKLIVAGNKGAVERRMETLRQWVSTLNIIPLDTKEMYSKTASSVTGYPDLLEIIMQWVVSDTPLPFSILFSKGGSRGLGAKGSGDAEVQLEMFREYCADEQQLRLRPDLEQQILPVVFAASEGPFNGTAPEKWSVVFNPLAVPSEKEQAETRKIVAETDKVYIDAGVVSPEWVTESRFGGQKYSSETKIPSNWKAELEAAAEAEAQAEAEMAAEAAAAAGGATGKDKLPKTKAKP